MDVPDDYRFLAQSISRQILPLKQIHSGTKAPRDFLLSGREVAASGKSLPPQHLLYFLFKELLGYNDLGMWEKVAWSIPIDFNGRAFLLEHGKFGVKLYQSTTRHQKDDVDQILQRIHKATRMARPFFEWIANKAAAASKLNVKNCYLPLFDRYDYFRALYETSIKKSKQQHELARLAQAGSEQRLQHFNRSRQLARESGWLSTATVEAFFSWTEHVFVLIAVLQGKLTTGVEVADLMDHEWKTKFRSALSISEPIARRLYDNLLEIRRQHRNFIAHGAFGKDGEAFTFHSSAGAAPLLLPHKQGSSRFTVHLEFSRENNDEETLSVLSEFIEYLWSSSEVREARIYLESGLPLILTMVDEYVRVIGSEEKMAELVDHLGNEWDRAGNMDW